MIFHGLLFYTCDRFLFPLGDRARTSVNVGFYKLNPTYGDGDRTAA
ncbi:MAG: hypothetical protein ACFE0I_10440 [Elainellaceae cyanobacterium]